MNRFACAALLFVSAALPAFGYIDPGTGSMLFSFLTGIAVTLFFFLKNLIIRLKTRGFRFGKESSGTGQGVVFHSEGGQYWNVFRPVIREFHQRGVPCLYCSSDRNDPGLSFVSDSVATRYIGEGNKAYRFLNFLEAEICVTTTPGLDVLQFKRSPGVRHYAHILHAVTDATLYRLFGLDYFDTVFLTGPYQAEDLRTLERLRGTPTKRLEVTGCTYLDELAARSRKDVPTADGRTVLLAPSWGENGILRRYGTSLLRPLAESGYRLIIRPHPQSFISEADVLRRLQEELATYQTVEWNSDRENLSAMARSDILISDFSGIIFDYLFLFRRPVLYAKFDFDPRPYDAGDLDRAPWTFRIVEQVGHPLMETDFPRISELLDGLRDDREKTAVIDRVREEAYAHPGEAGKRIADILLRLRKELSPDH